MESQIVQELEDGLTAQGLPPISTVVEVAKALKCSRGIVYAAVQRGDLQVVRLGSGQSHIRVSIDAVARWLARFRN